MQLDVSVGEPSSGSRAHAFGNDRPLTDVAEDVVARRLRFDATRRRRVDREPTPSSDAVDVDHAGDAATTSRDGGPMPREALLARTLVELADTLVDDFDVVELLTLLADRCVEVLDVAAAGLMLVAPDGELRVVASSSEAMRVLELFELQAEEGPCMDCYRTGEPW